jgi:class 3 adenylate cyclase
MEESPELVNFMEQCLTMFGDSSIGNSVDMLARSPGTLTIGTAPGEWWMGYEVNEAATRLQYEEFNQIGSHSYNIQEIHAFREGSVGWIAARAELSIGTLDPIPLRFTAVVHREGIYWRFVQMHISEPVSNREIEQSLGRPMTTTIDDILLLVQDHDVPATAVAADGSVTIAFTDIADSTELMGTLGEERWLELLAWHDHVARSQVEVFGGTVVKGQGDGFMLAFASPGSAAACAMAMQRVLSQGWEDVPLSVRMGLHCGTAKSEDGDYYGRTVVIAARISGHASGGEILVSQEVQERLAGSLPLDQARELSLKGLTGEWQVFSIRWR